MKKRRTKITLNQWNRLIEKKLVKHQRRWAKLHGNAAVNPPPRTIQVEQSNRMAILIEDGVALVKAVKEGRETILSHQSLLLRYGPRNHHKKTSPEKRREYLRRSTYDTFLGYYVPTVTEGYPVTIEPDDIDHYHYIGFGVYITRDGVASAVKEVLVNRLPWARKTTCEQYEQAWLGVFEDMEEQYGDILGFYYNCALNHNGYTMTLVFRHEHDAVMTRLST